MAKYQIVIEEIVRYTVAVEADNEEAANAAALDEFLQADNVDPYYDSVNGREIIATVEVDANGDPV